MKTYTFDGQDGIQGIGVYRILNEVTADFYPGLVSPSGERFRNIHNLTAFCRERGLVPQMANLVARGKMDQHKGWRLLSE